MTKKGEKNQTDSFSPIRVKLGHSSHTLFAIKPAYGRVRVPRRTQGIKKTPSCESEEVEKDRFSIRGTL